MSSRSRQKFLPQDLTDDEDSDLDNFTDDSRARMRKQEPRQRSKRNTEQINLDYREAEVVSRIQKMKEKSKFIRERRSGSLTNWPTTKDRDSGSLTPSDDELRKVSTRFRKSSLTSPIAHHKKLLSDSASEKEKELPNKQKSSVKVSPQQVQSDSASEREVPKEKVSTSKLKKKVETESENDFEEQQPEPVKQKLESEIRPLKVAASTSTNITNGHKEPIKLEERKIQENKVNEKIPIKVEEKQTTKPKAAEDIKETPKPEPQKVSEPLEAWECPHCTFVNEAASKICTICCKTRVEVLDQIPEEQVDEDIDINEINESILQNESESKQKGKARKISFLPGTKAH